MISRTNSGEEQHAGAPDGLILIPTTSFGSTNFANAAVVEFSPVNSFSPRSQHLVYHRLGDSVSRNARASATSTTRPGYNPGMPNGDFFAKGASCTSIGGACGITTCSVPSTGTPAEHQSRASCTSSLYEGPSIHSHVGPNLSLQKPIQQRN